MFIKSIKRLKRYVAHYEILWHRVQLHNELSALEYLLQRQASYYMKVKKVSSVTRFLFQV